MRHAALVKELADGLRRRDIAALVYFHADHFEPWRPLGSAPAVGSEVVDGIHAFLRMTERIDFARRLTLFYKPHLNYALRRGGELVRADPADLLGFLPRTESEERFGRAAMEAVAGLTRHEIQLHIHHEYYTATRVHSDPSAIAWFASPLGRALDEQRLELAIRLNREIIARESGRAPQHWFFVHGQWALNASDDSACTITNELAILQRNGCRGDFTFPGGRPKVNPRITVPYLCRPVNEPKGYDRPEAEPEIALGNRAAASSKFFVWASTATGKQCSLDYISEAGRRHIANTEKAAKELIDASYVAGRRLFIKTHAHSMHSHYFEHVRSPVFPHQHPAAQSVLSVIFDAAAQAGIEVEFLTAGEVYDRLIEADTKPALDLVATYLGSVNPFRGGMLPSRNVLRASLPGAPTRGRPQAGEEPLANGKGRMPACAVERVRDAVSRVLEERIARLGVLGSGAYEHYRQMLRLGFPIPNYELAALDIVRQQVPPLAAYHEIGSGIGSLPFLLALNGLRSAGIERDRRRHDTAAAIWRELAASAGVAKTECRLVYGSFPRAVARADLSRSIAIVTDFITTQTAEEREAILEGLLGYRYVLIDLRRFCLRRETRDAQLALLDELRAKGFPTPSETADPAGAEYAFALFDNALSRRRVLAKPPPLAARRDRFSAALHRN
jgi:hypothetical protein